MNLPVELVSKFVKVTRDEVETKQETTVQGTIVVQDNGKYVKLDGSDVLTPVALTAEANDGERVTVLIKDHTATVTGNMTSPSARVQSVEQIGDKVTAVEILVADKVSTIYFDAQVARIDSLTADNVTIKENLFSQNAAIENLKTEKLSAEQADIKYAFIDFSNIGEAAIAKLFADSGIIEDLVMSEGHVTGHLVGVTIKGDLIEGGTVVADKLVILGDDGLYYKLNTNGVTTESEQTEYNSLNGSIITAKSVTAEKVAVEDLVAFGATIGGFVITDNAIHSKEKGSPTLMSRGIYMDNDGQLGFGDDVNYVRYYKDSDGNYKLEISAQSIKFGASSKNVEEAISELNTSIEEQASVTESLKTDTETLKTDTETLKSDLGEQVTAVSALSSEFEQTTESFKMELIKKADSEEIRKWARYEDGTLELGDSESRYQLEASPTGVVVLQDGSPMTRMEQNTVMSPVFDVGRMLTFKNHKISVSASGALLFN